MAAVACPNCERIFKDHSSVLKHMNHRYSSCHRWFIDNPEPPPHTEHLLNTHAAPSSRYFPNAGHVFDSGPGFMGWFHNDEEAEARSSNPYHPFLLQGKWEIMEFLSCSGLSMKLIDKFLSLVLVSVPNNLKQCIAYLLLDYSTGCYVFRLPFLSFMAKS